MNNDVNDIVHEVHIVRKTHIKTKKVIEEVLYVFMSKKNSKKIVINKKNDVAKKEEEL